MKIVPAACARAQAMGEQSPIIGNSAQPASAVVSARSGTGPPDFAEARQTGAPQGPCSRAHGAEQSLKRRREVPGVAAAGSSAGAARQTIAPPINFGTRNFGAPRHGYESDIRYATGKFVLQALGSKSDLGEPLVTRLFEPPDGSILYGRVARREGFMGDIVVFEPNWFTANMLEQMVASPTTVADHIVRIHEQIISAARKLSTISVRAAEPNSDRKLIEVFHSIDIDSNLTFSAEPWAAQLLAKKIRSIIHDRLRELMAPLLAPGSTPMTPFDIQTSKSEIAALTWLLQGHNSHHTEMRICGLHVQIDKRLNHKMSRRGKNRYTLFRQQVCTAGLQTDLCRVSELLKGAVGKDGESPTLNVLVENQSRDHWATEARADDFVVRDLPDEATLNLNHATQPSSPFDLALAAAWKKSARVLIVCRHDGPQARNYFGRMGLKICLEASGQGPIKKKSSGWFRKPKRPSGTHPPRDIAYIVAVNYDPDQPLLPLLPLPPLLASFHNPANIAPLSRLQAPDAHSP